MHPGLIGAIVGCVVGLIGGIIGTWASIRNTSGPRERAFMIKAGAVVWIVGLIFLALLIFLPSPWRFLVWIPYGILFPLGIIFGNRAHQRIRAAEAADRQPPAPPEPPVSQP